MHRDGRSRRTACSLCVLEAVCEQLLLRFLHLLLLLLRFLHLLLLLLRFLHLLLLRLCLRATHATRAVSPRRAVTRRYSPLRMDAGGASARARRRSHATLSAEAAARGVRPSRLLRASRSPTASDHIARVGCCSLSLDSRLWGAHTTALDSLAAAVGVVTVRGAHVGARTAHSLLLAVGMGALSTLSQRASADLVVALLRRRDGAEALRPADVQRGGAQRWRGVPAAKTPTRRRTWDARSAVAIEVDLE